MNSNDSVSAGQREYKVIAVDFDGCICADKYPDCGEPHLDVIGELLAHQRCGGKVILWTCREGEQLDAAVEYCGKYGLKFDAVNDNLPENKAQYGNNSRKVYADEYWDDKAVCVDCKRRF